MVVTRVSYVVMGIIDQPVQKWCCSHIQILGVMTTNDILLRIGDTNTHAETKVMLEYVNYSILWHIKTSSYNSGGREITSRTRNAIFRMKNFSSKGECKMIILHEFIIGSYSQIMRILVKSSTEIQRTV